MTAKGDAARHLALALAHFRHAVLTVHRIGYLPFVGLDLPLVGLDLPFIPESITCVRLAWLACLGWHGICTLSAHTLPEPSP